MDECAESLIRRLARGERPEPRLRRLLLEELATGDDDGDRGVADRISDAARSAGAWVGASPRERGEALLDLLGLADAFPVDFRSPVIGFPRLDSSRGE